MRKKHKVMMDTALEVLAGKPDGMCTQDLLSAIREHKRDKAKGHYSGRMLSSITIREAGIIFGRDPRLKRVGQTNSHYLGAGTTCWTLKEVTA